MKEFYLSQPEILRKAERDWFVTFCGAMLAATAVTGDAAPSVGVFFAALIPSISLATYRTIRRYLEQGAGS